MAGTHPVVDRASSEQLAARTAAGLTAGGDGRQNPEGAADGEGADDCDDNYQEPSLRGSRGRAARVERSHAVGDLDDGALRCEGVLERPGDQRACHTRMPTHEGVAVCAWPYALNHVTM